MRTVITISAEQADLVWQVQIHEGSIVSVYGRRGSVAESLLSSIASGENPSSVQHCPVKIAINGRNASHFSMREYVKLVSYLPEDMDTFLANLYVDEEIGFYLENIAIPEDQIQLRVDHVAKQLGIAHLLGRTITSLSGGQKQLVAIAGVLCTQTPILLLEEPLSNLDPENRELIWQLLKQQASEGRIVIFSGLDWSDWMSQSDRQLVFDQGKPIYDGKPLSRKESARLVTDKDVAVSGFQHVHSANTNFHRPTRPSERELVINDLMFCYLDDTPVLDRANLRLSLDCVIGIIGKNGSGKTTLARILAGLLRPSDGSFMFNNFDANSNEIRVSYAFQNPKLQFLADSVRDEICFPFRFSGADNQDKQSLRTFLAEFDLEVCSEVHPLRLQPLKQRECILAALLATSPHLLIIDEPSNGLDTIERLTIASRIRSIFEAGVSIIVISHDEQTLASIADKIVSVRDGKLIEQGMR